MTTAAQEFVAYALTVGALELVPEGRELKSKRISPYFFNSARFTSGNSTTKLARAYARVITPFEFDVLYGPPYKGTLLAPAITMALWEEEMTNRSWASSRKEVKGHGEGGIMLGAPLQGEKVVIVDDVITTGATKSDALELVRLQGGAVVGVVIAFDRMETAPESDLSAAQLFTKQHKVPVHAAATLNDLIAVLRKDFDFPGNAPGMLEKILEYKDTYGVK